MKPNQDPTLESSIQNLKQWSNIVTILIIIVVPIILIGLGIWQHKLSQKIDNSTKEIEQQKDLTAKQDKLKIQKQLEEANEELSKTKIGLETAKDILAKNISRTETVKLSQALKNHFIALYKNDLRGDIEVFYADGDPVAQFIAIEIKELLHNDNWNIIKFESKKLKIYETGIGVKSYDSELSKKLSSILWSKCSTIDFITHSSSNDTLKNDFVTLTIGYSPLLQK